MMMNPFSYLALYKNCSMHVKLLRRTSFIYSHHCPHNVRHLPEHKDHRKAIDGDHRAYLQQTENELESELNRLAISSSVAQTSMCMRCWKKQDSNISLAKNTMT